MKGKKIMALSMEFERNLIGALLQINESLKEIDLSLGMLLSSIDDLKLLAPKE